jgi:hypothetical protein
MEAKNKSAKKKRHVSKHVLKAREGKAGEVQKKEANDPDQQVVVPAEETNGTPKPVSKEQKQNVKDPSDAAEYLANWENRETNSWKFNKNKQSWLIRRMYEVEKVPKGSFKILLEYLRGLQGDSMRLRIRAEASRRARRYKEHVKKSSAGDEDSNGEEEVAMKGGDDNKKKDKKIVKNAPSKQELLEEEARWVALDENDKRKEYKRARMILDAFKE